MSAKKQWKTWGKWLRIYVMGLVAVLPEQDRGHGITFLLPDSHAAAAHGALAHHAILTFGAELSPCNGSIPLPRDDGEQIKKALRLREAPKGWILSGEEIVLRGGKQGRLSWKEPDRSPLEQLKWIVNSLLKKPLRPTSHEDATSTQWLPSLRTSRWRKARALPVPLRVQEVVALMSVNGVQARLKSELLTVLPARPQCRRLAGTVPILELRSADDALQRSPQAMAEAMALDIAYGTQYPVRVETFTLSSGGSRRTRCAVLKPAALTGRIEILLANLTPLTNCIQDPERVRADLHFNAYYSLVSGVEASRRLSPTLPEGGSRVRAREVVRPVLPDLLEEVSDHPKKGGLSRPFCTGASTGAATAVALPHSPGRPLSSTRELRAVSGGGTCRRSAFPECDEIRLDPCSTPERVPSSGRRVRQCREGDENR